MALLIDVQAPDWMSNEGLRDFLRPLLLGEFGERRFARATPFLAAVRDYLDRARDG